MIKTYEIRWQRIYECRLEVEADSPEEARRIFNEERDSRGWQQDFMDEDYFEVEEV